MSFFTARVSALYDGHVTESDVDRLSIDGFTTNTSELAMGMNVYAFYPTNIEDNASMTRLCTVPTLNITFIFNTFEFTHRI